MPWLYLPVLSGTVTPSADMTSFLETLSTVATAIWAQVTQACNVIITTPFLAFTLGFLFVGGAIGIVGRLISRN